MDHLEKELSRKPPTLLYHYTSQRGLLGILKNNEIWATKIQYLNDGSEFVYFIDLLKEWIGVDTGQSRVIEIKRHEEIKDGAVKKIVQLGLSEINSLNLVKYHERLNSLNSKLEDNKRNISEGEFDLFFGNVIAFLTSFKNTTVFVCSFSEKGNLLSQWRAYCPPAGGFSVGFNSEKLKTISDKFSLKPCVYCKNEQFEMIDNLVVSLAKNSCDLGQSLGQRVKNGRLNLYKFMEMASIFKHPSFFEEQEWRLVSVVDPDKINFLCKQVDFREGESMIVPYFKIKLPEETESLIKKVIVGPTPHKDLSIASVKGLLTHKKIKIEAEMDDGNFKNKTVEWCGIPYQTW